MIKRMKCGLICVVMLVFLASLSTKVMAEEFEYLEEENQYESQFNIYQGYELQQYFGTDKNVIIPDSVSRIMNYAFSDSSFVENITIPDSVINVGYRAFDNTEWYKGLRRKSEYVSAAGILFEYTGSDTRVIVPDGIRFIGEDFCAYNRNITEAVIPEGVIGIGGGAFSDCSNLKKVSLPSSLRFIDSKAFGNNSVDVLTLGANIEGIGWDIFSGFYAREYNTEKETGTGTQVVFFDGLAQSTKFGIVREDGLRRHPFWGVPFIIVPKGTDLSSTIFHESYATRYSNVYGESVGGESENLCELVTKATKSKKGVLNLIRHAGEDSTTLPDKVLVDGKTYVFKEIKNEAMSYEAYYENYTSIRIPEGYTSIGKKAFYKQEKLKYVTIPKSVKTIASDAFKGCKKVTIVGYKNSYAQKYANKYNIKFMELNPTALLKRLKASSTINMIEMDNTREGSPITYGLIQVDKFTGNDNEVILSFKSSNKDVARVDRRGYINSYKEGKAIVTVTAKLANGTKKTFKITVNVKRPYHDETL